MRQLRLTIAYDGTEYVGWQVQSNGISVQERLETAWRRITGESRRIVASGRTDSGVHALGQVCGLETGSQLDDVTLVRALNAILPDDVSVLDLVTMAGGFDPIRDAVRKTYRYQIQSGRRHDVFARRFWWFVPPELDVASMKRASKQIIGRHDFECFQTAGSERLTTVRTISDLNIFERVNDPYQWVTIEVTADGFLYNMVRCIAGTLALVGLHKRPVEWVREVIDSRDRMLAGPTAPSHALILVSVHYELEHLPESTRVIQ